MFRFSIGRFLVHLGLNIMPPGRAKAELVSLFEKWAEHVYRVNRT